MAMRIFRPGKGREFYRLLRPTVSRSRLGRRGIAWIYVAEVLEFLLRFASEALGTHFFDVVEPGARIRVLASLGGRAHASPRRLPCRAALDVDIGQRSGRGGRKRRDVSRYPSLRKVRYRNCA